MGWGGTSEVEERRRPSSNLRPALESRVMVAVEPSTQTTLEANVGQSHIDLVD